MNTSFYSINELSLIGFKRYGKNVMISRKTSIYSPEKISIGDNVRIDDFCVLSGEITIGSYVHISTYVGIYAGEGVVLEDYTGLSSKCTIYSAMDDFSGNYMIAPLPDPKYTNLHGGPVILKRFVQVGVNSTVFPNVTINEGSVIGAHSLVNKCIEPWGIYVGVPCRKIKDRSNKIVEIEKQLRTEK